MKICKRSTFSPQILTFNRRPLAGYIFFSTAESKKDSYVSSLYSAQTCDRINSLIKRK